MFVKGKGEEYLLGQGDLIYIAPGEEREVQVIGTEPVTALVMIIDID
jgi:quercetin dioxygenase-like cupin family protein